jgi:hypothetical protein
VRLRAQDVEEAHGAWSGAERAIHHWVGDEDPFSLVLARAVREQELRCGVVVDPDAEGGQEVVGFVGMRPTRVSSRKRRRGCMALVFRVAGNSNDCDASV